MGRRSLAVLVLLATAGIPAAACGGGGASTPDAQTNHGNPCAIDNGGCAHDATCGNLNGTAECTCKNGFAGDGKTCTDIDECRVTNGGCDANAICANQPGTHTCTCKPGFLGDGLTCQDVASALDGLRWELPCEVDSMIDPRVCASPGLEIQTRMVTGTPGTTYDVILRFRGVIETKGYDGGTNDGHFWQIGGTPKLDLANAFRLDVSAPAQTYYLNRGPGAEPFCDGIDYTQTIQLAAGATVTLTADPVDATSDESRNLDQQMPPQPIVVPGVPPDPQPFDGQFIQMNVQAVTSH